MFEAVTLLEQLNLLSIIDNLRVLEHLLLSSESGEVSLDLRGEFAKGFTQLLDNTSGAGFQFTSRQIERVIEHLISNKRVLFDDVRRLAEEIKNRIHDELDEAVVFIVSQSKYEYRPWVESPFGDVVKSNFPSTVKEAFEAHMCFLCDRNTACVYHLMRIMETALKALAKGLRIPFAPSWETYLRQINDRITAKHKTKLISWKRDEAFFRDLCGDLQAVKIAWRNPTMHMVRYYDSDEAEDVYRAVTTFMQTISLRFTEKGMKPFRRASV